MDPKKIKVFHRSIARWYRRHRRELQWRKTRDSYHILVSEIMLQQTQVSRVKEKLPQFLKRFPSLKVLAHAPKADVIRAWSGMGYNNRAIRLRELAGNVMQNYNGTIPRNIDKLEQLPGIGRYTSHAFLCFAFGKRVPVVDINIRRVFSRIFFRMKQPDDLIEIEDCWKLAENILPRNAYTWNQALMDLGSTICTARNPLCGQCPIAPHCASRKFLNRTGLPQKRKIKREPNYNGIPRRIWRGKVVEVLRNVNGRGHIEMNDIGTAINPDFNRKELPWLRSIVDALVVDGIAEVKSVRSKTVVMLATG